MSVRVFFLFLFFVGASSSSCFIFSIFFFAMSCRGWAAGWGKNVGIRDPVGPPHLGRIFPPAPMYSRPARSLEGTEQQDGTVRRR